jgi:hypothetical protein
MCPLFFALIFFPISPGTMSGYVADDATKVAGLLPETKEKQRSNYKNQ